MRPSTRQCPWRVWPLIVGLGAILFWTGACSAAPFGQDDPGTTGLPFLQIPMGPRSAGMGGAYTAVARGPESLWWNPSGLIGSETTAILLENSFLMDDLLMDTLACQIPLDKGDALGIMVTRVGFNLPMPGYDQMGLETKSVEYGEMLFAAGYGTDAFEVPFGFVVKVLTSQLADASALCLAGDLGVRQDFLKQDLSLGLSLRNMGQKVKYVSTGFPLPFTINLGAAYRLLGRDLVLAGDVQMPFDRKPHYHLGLEFSRKLQLAFQFSVRTGYSTNFVENTDPMNGLNAGLSIDWRLNQRTLARTGRMLGYKEALLFLLGLDYAWIPNSELGASHRLSVRIEF